MDIQTSDFYLCPTISTKLSLAESGEMLAPYPAKRPRYHYHRHHALVHRPQQVLSSEPAISDQDTLDRLLLGSIKAICEEEATRQDLFDPSIESVVFESLRNMTEEYILKLCMTIRRSMLAARRTVPIAPDFQSVARALDKQIPIDQIGPYQTQPAINPALLPTPPPENIFHNHVVLSGAVLGPELDGEAQRKKEKFIPSSLPTLPSTHTYKATPVFPGRETDPRRIRELATEEGKLGEQALRNLAGAMKLENKVQSEPTLKEPASVFQIPNTRQRRKPETSEEALFEETMRELLARESPEDQKAFEVRPVVSAEKKFWRPDDMPLKRRAVNAGGGVSTDVLAENT